MTLFFLVRHGQTEWSNQHRYTGWSDLPVDATGRLQEDNLMARLASESIDAIFSSDLQRCSELAYKIAYRQNNTVSLHNERELREANFGKWEGRTYAEIEAAEPERLQCWIDDPLMHAPPGGETLLELAGRVGPCLERIEAVYPAGCVLVITHGGPIRCALCRWLGIPLKNHWQLRIDPASLTIVDTYPQGAILNLLNDTHYLR